jgi:hypothetical protein
MTQAQTQPQLRITRESNLSSLGLHGELPVVLDGALVGDKDVHGYLIGLGNSPHAISMRVIARGKGRSILEYNLTMPRQDIEIDDRQMNALEVHLLSQRTATPGDIIYSYYSGQLAKMEKDQGAQWQRQ